jgi:hypothetical protein
VRYRSVARCPVYFWYLQPRAESYNLGELVSCLAAVVAVAIPCFALTFVSFSIIIVHFLVVNHFNPATPGNRPLVLVHHRLVHHPLYGFSGRHCLTLSQGSRRDPNDPPPLSTVVVTIIITVRRRASSLLSLARSRFAWLDLNDLSYLPLCPCNEQTNLLNGRHLMDWTFDLSRTVKPDFIPG